MHSNINKSHDKQEEIQYSFGCCLVSIRPRIEGRYFQKEYIFDKQGNEGRGVFLHQASTPSTLIHVREVMGETEYVNDGGGSDDD